MSSRLGVKKELLNDEANLKSEIFSSSLLSFVHILSRCPKTKINSARTFFPTLSICTFSFHVKTYMICCLSRIARFKQIRRVSVFVSDTEKIFRIIKYFSESALNKQSSKPCCRVKLFRLICEEWIEPNEKQIEHLFK